MAKFLVKFPEGARIVHYGMPKPKRPKPGQVIEVWDDIARPGRHVVDWFGNDKTNRPHETFADAYRCQPDLYEEISGAPPFWRTGNGPSKPTRDGWAPDTDRKAPDFAVPEVEVATLKDPLEVEGEELEWAPGYGPAGPLPSPSGRRQAAPAPEQTTPSTEGDPS